MDTGTVRIYSSEDSPRLRYIAGIILGDILGLTWEVITDKRKLRKHPVLNYSEENINASYRILPHSLLFETGVSNREISIGSWSGLPVFFETPGESDFPFDIFAASFYLITRYEEYLSHEPDEHGRFRASSSIAFRYGFLSIPVIDLWVKEFARTFMRKIRNITFRRNEYRALLTFDADQPYAFPEKSIFRSIEDMMRGVSHHNQDKTADRDPYDVYGYIGESISRNKCETRFFLPVGDKTRFDRNPSWKNSRYRELINKLSEDHITGLHPSYSSFLNAPLLLKEKNRLNEITGKNVRCSRFHYLRFKMPQSYRNLCESEFAEDYSMGYIEEPGFRAGIARPFYFYDLLKDEQTNLRIFPFQVMDETLFEKKKLNPDESKKLINHLVDETRKIGGVFVSIWHNTSLLDDDNCRQNREIFEFLLNAQQNDNLS